MKSMSGTNGGSFQGTGDAGSEYNLVTSYLTDMEEIDALPPEIREQLGNMAKKIVDIEDNQKQQQNKKKIMSDEEYNHMDRLADCMPEGL